MKRFTVSAVLCLAMAAVVAARMDRHTGELHEEPRDITSLAKRLISILEAKEAKNKIKNHERRDMEEDAAKMPGVIFATRWLNKFVDSVWSLETPLKKLVSGWETFSSGLKTKKAHVLFGHIEKTIVGLAKSGEGEWDEVLDDIENIEPEEINKLKNEVEHVKNEAKQVENEAVNDVEALDLKKIKGEEANLEKDALNVVNYAKKLENVSEKMEKDAQNAVDEFLYDLKHVDPKLKNNIVKVVKEAKNAVDEGVEDVEEVDPKLKDDIETVEKETESLV